MSSVSIVIPAKDEARPLAILLPKLSHLGVGEIIVVDDGSTDETRSVCESNNVTVISHPYSKGNGAAIKTGLKAAENEVVVFMDADGQHSSEAIQTLLKRYKEGYAMVVGARSFSGQANISRGVANVFYNWFASKMVGHKVHDLTSGMRVVNRRKMLEFYHLLPNRFSYPTTITMAFFRAGYSVGYEAIDVARREGKSHIRPVRDGIRFLIIIFKVATLYSPLKVFLPIATFIFLLGLTYYGYTFAAFGRFTNMSALMFTTSLTIFLIGLISEQITTLMYSKT